MPRGKKTAPEDIYKIMASWAVTNSYSETARELGIPVTTVKRVVDCNKGEPDFMRLCREKRSDFSRSASEIIGKGLILLNRRFDRAIAEEVDLDLLLGEIFASGSGEISQEDKLRLANRIKALQLQDVKAISTVIGTLYDKKALADGAATGRVDVEIKLPPGVCDYAE